MELVLHVGAHRTGTTTLQEYLRRHRPALIARGILPVLPAETRGPLFAGLVQRPADATPAAAAQAGAARRAVLAELDRSAEAGLRRVLISEENLAGSLRANLRRAALYPDIGERMRWLGPDLCRRVTRVGLSVRSYDGYWTSALTYGVANGAHVPRADDALRLAAVRRGWCEMALALARAFPRAEILVWTFEDFVARPARLTRLLARVGDLGQDPPPARNNASPPAADLRRLLAARGEAGAAALLPRTGRWAPFDDARRAAMAARYRADLARIDGLADGRVRLIRLTGRAPDPLTRIAGQAGAAARRAPVSPDSIPPEGGSPHGRYG